MQRNPTISNSKIIAFVVFVCAALITSLFVYHTSHQIKQANLSNNAGLIFPVPRDIKNFELITANNQKFTENNLRNHWTLLFFGFTHCGSVCPATLDMMKRVYPDLHKTYPNLQVVLVSLDPERDTPDIVTKYATSFNPDFIGTTAKMDELRKLQSQFGVYSARDENSGSNYQLQHTPSIMFITPEGKWAGFFRFGMKPSEFNKAFAEGIAILRG